MSVMSRLHSAKRARPAFPVLDVIAERWSPRSFADRPVPAKSLRQVLEAARWAPSSYNEQPWRFLIATKAEAKGFERLASCLDEHNRAWAQSAPVLMLVVARMRFSRNDKPNRHAWHDVGLATGNLIVQATALGLYGHLMAGILPSRAKELYDIPEAFEPVTGLALGFLGSPDDLPEKQRARETAPRTRRPQSDFVFADVWGQPAELRGTFKNAPSGR